MGARPFYAEIPREEAVRVPGAEPTAAPAPTPRATAMLDLMNRAEAAAEKMGADNPNGQLIADLSMALVAMFKQVKELEARLTMPRIVLP